MPRSCTVCGHPELAAIGKSIAAGGSNRNLASRFNVTPAAVQRHRAGCLKQPRREKKVAPESTLASAGGSNRIVSTGDSTPADPRTLLHRAELLLNDAHAILTRASSAGDDRMALQAVRETRASLELVMKAHGMLAGDGTTINIDARRGASLEALPPTAWRALLRLADAEDSPTITIDADEVGIAAPALMPAEGATDNRRLPVVSEVDDASQ